MRRKSDGTSSTISAAFVVVRRRSRLCPSAGRRLRPPPAFLRLAPAQVFPQRRRQALAAAAGFLRFLVVLAHARHGGIIPGACGFARSALCLAPMGDDMAVSAAFAPPPWRCAIFRCRSSVVEHPLGKILIYLVNTLI